MNHTVMISVLVNVRVKGVPADNHPEAIERAKKLASDPLLEQLLGHKNPTPSIKHTDYYGEHVAYLVDEEGDPLHLHSSWYAPDGETPLKGAPQP